MSVSEHHVAISEFERIPQHLLDIEEKTRCNLFPWRGQFSPQLVEVLLRTWGPSSGLVLDPFAGSGTVLVEAARLGLSAAGAEVNPAAVIMAVSYRLINRGKAERRRLLSSLEAKLSTLSKALGIGPLFADEQVDGDSLPAFVAGLRRELAAHRDAQLLLDTLVVTADLAANPSARLLHSTWRWLRETIMELPHSEHAIEVLLNDARQLPLADASVDMVLTSPPYINVFNYHQQYRKSVELLGWNVLNAARSEIGSNRKHRQNRLLTVVQYCLDLADTLRELIRVCKPGAPLVLVVGRESNVRKTSFFNGELVTRIGTESLGLRLVGRQERSFSNKFGKKIFEDILCFQNTPVREESTPPREIGVDALRDAFERAPDESISDLDDAIERAAEVKPSRLLDPAAARPDTAE